MLIQYNELRIGNILQTSEGYVRVTGISENASGLICEPYPHVHESRKRMSDISGVLLTEAIIKSCGGQTQHHSFFELEYIRPIFLQKVEGGWELTHNPGRISKVPMQYLHQLQNAYFAIVGKELPFPVG